MPRASFEDFKRDVPVIGEAIRRALAGDPEPVVYPPTGEPITVELLPGGLGAAVSTPSKPRFYRERWTRPPKLGNEEKDQEAATSE